MSGAGRRVSARVADASSVPQRHLEMHWRASVETSTFEASLYRFKISYVSTASLNGMHGISSLSMIGNHARSHYQHQRALGIPRPKLAHAIHAYLGALIARYPLVLNVGRNFVPQHEVLPCTYCPSLLHLAGGRNCCNSSHAAAAARGW